MNPEDQPVVAAKKAPGPRKDPRYSKVGGWLAWFCLGLVFGVPIVYVQNSLSDYSTLSPMFPLYPRLPVVFGIATALTAGMVVFALVAGARLYRLKKNAPYIAKIFLLTIFGHTVVSGALYLLAGLPESFNEAYIQAMVTAILRQGIASGVWIAYFASSKRVKLTYGDAALAPEATSEPARAEAGASIKKVVCPQCQQYDEVPADRIYEPGRYTKFEASAKRSFGFLNLKLTCRSCGKQFKYEEVSGDS